jgi:hypothetical protein
MEVWQRFLASGQDTFTLSFPSDWFALGNGDAAAFSNVSTPRPISDQTVHEQAILGIELLRDVNPQGLSIDSWFDSYFASGFSNDLIDRRLVTLAGRPAVQIELIEIGRRVHFYVPIGTSVLELSYGLTAPQFVPIYESIIQGLTF